MTALDTSPYRQFVHIYLDRGWVGTLPLPPRRKQHPPKGFTGADGADPSAADVMAWLEGDEANGNVALRLPDTVIGVDVDDYDAKTGGQTLARLEADLGPLPPTWVSTSRDDRVSGIRLYRVPAGLPWPDEVGQYIDVIRRGHRYLVAEPSIHPEGRTYGWLRQPDWQPCEPPRVDDLPALPQAWVDKLTAPSAGRTGSGWTDPDLDELVERGIPRGANQDAALRDVVWKLRSQRVARAATHAVWSGIVAKTPTTRVGDPWTDADFDRHWDGADRKIARAEPTTLRVQTSGAGASIDAPFEEAPHRGQVRMAYRLGQLHGGDLMHVHALGWHAWDGTRWAEDDAGAARRAVLDVLRGALLESLERHDKDLRSDVARCESASGIDGVLTIASALKAFAATVRDLDTDPYLLNVANGTLDLRILDLRPHDPSDRITKITRAAWRPETTSTAWADFIASVLPDEDVREFLQRLVGVGLLGKVVEHILAIQTGTGANGKGTAYKAQLWALGDYASTAEPDLFMAREGAHPTGEMDLRGRRLVVVSESDKDRRLAEATMKRLTGGDPIKARRMRADFVEFEPSHTAILVTNHLPKVTGDDPAIWRRVRVVPFDVTFASDQQDTTLDDRLRLDADAVLAWAVDGYRQYVRDGLAEPEAVRVATERYQLDSDALSRFLEERCRVGEHYRCPAGQLFEAWTHWCSAEGVDPGSKKAFGVSLDRKGYPDGRTMNSRLRKGIALRAEGGDDDDD